MTAQEFAKKEGFAGARRLTAWNGYACYEAIIDDDDETIPIVGFPQIIIANGNEMRMADYDEALQIIGVIK